MECPAAGGDNNIGQTGSLQRLLTDVQLLQSKLHHFNAQLPPPDQNVRPNIGQSNSALVSDSAKTEIDKLKKHYEAEVLLMAVLPYI